LYVAVFIQLNAQRTNYPEEGIATTISSSEGGAKHILFQNEK